jgi:hypothetical protein
MLENWTNYYLYKCIISNTRFFAWLNKITAKTKTVSIGKNKLFNLLSSTNSKSAGSASSCLVGGGPWLLPSTTSRGEVWFGGGLQENRNLRNI